MNQNRIVFNTTRNYYVALMTIIYCSVIMSLMFFVIENALWQVMLLPIFFNIPVVFLAKKTLKDISV